ncbi:MAG: response regulator [Paenibacillus sp.]|jgi:two-component system response regulator YesN|nr:response regulator [Paenibacillus sp.]
MTYHVLIVDDEPIVRQGLLSFNWEKYGFEAVGTCGNGREALEWLNHNHVELVVTDIKMPGIDGVELSRQVKELYPDILVVLLTGYNEFTYAQQAIKSGVFDYLLKPAEDEDFDNVLGKAYQVLKDKEEKKRLQDVMAYHFILRNQLKESHLSVEAIQIDIDREDPFRLCLLYTPDDIIELQIIRIIEKWKFVQINKREWIALISEEDVEPISLALSGAGFNLGISSCKNGRDEISGAFQEASQALQKKFLHPEDLVFHYSEQGDEGNQLQQVTGILKKAILFMNRVNGMNAKLVEHSFGEIMEAIKEKELSVPYIRQLMSYMIAALERELAKASFFPAEVWSLKKEQFLHIVKTADKLEIIEQSLFSEICGFIQEMQINNAQNKESAKLHEVLDYIHEHFNEVVSLDLISEQFRMHPNSFSKWFKEYKGMNFIDYLTRYRIDKSKEMLEQTDLKTGQIAEAVGFQDPRYFGQVFKKLVNLTPTEYRALFK